MPHISKEKTNHQVMDKMKNSLIKIITKSQNNKTIVQELITKTEYIMLAKRLAIIILLSKKVSFYTISKNLKVSTSTVVRFQKDIILGKYKSITNLVYLKNKKGDKLLDILEKVLQMGMPAYTGKGRWSWLNKMGKR